MAPMGGKLSVLALAGTNRLTALLVRVPTFVCNANVDGQPPGSVNYRGAMRTLQLDRVIHLRLATANTDRLCRRWWPASVDATLSASETVRLNEEFQKPE